MGQIRAVRPPSQRSPVARPSNLQAAFQRAWHRAQQLVADAEPLTAVDVPMTAAILALPRANLVGSMMIPSLAANNAASAANNVNANLNQVIQQLSSTVSLGHPGASPRRPRSH